MGSNARYLHTIYTWDISLIKEIFSLTGEDLVSRLSITSVMGLKTKMKRALVRCKLPKYQASISSSIEKMQGLQWSCCNLHIICPILDVDLAQ